MAARPVQHVASDRWFVDETYSKVEAVWSYVYRAVDPHGQVIDVYVSRRRDVTSARTFLSAGRRRAAVRVGSAFDELRPAI